MEVARKVVELLPSWLKKHAYLQEFHGTIEWASRSILHQYSGWFSGRPNEIQKMTRREKAEKTVELIGGEAKAMEVAQKAFADEDYQWSLELCEYLVLVEWVWVSKARVRWNK